MTTTDPNLTAGDPPPLSGRIVLADGTEQPLTAVFFGLDGDRVAVYRAMSSIPADRLDDAAVEFPAMPPRSRIELMFPMAPAAPPPAQHRVPAAACPGCHLAVDGATSLTSTAPPDPGDATVCIYCATIAIYTDDLQLRHPTIAELDVLLANPDVTRALAVVRKRITSHLDGGR